MLSEELNRLSPLQLSAVKEVANIGLGHSAKSLADMTGIEFHLSVPDVDSVPVDQLSSLMGGPFAITVGVFMPFVGAVEGHLAFLFPWESAQSVWTLLMGSAPEDFTQIGEVEASAMIEIGNILNSHFLNAVAEMTGLELHSTVPSVGVDAAMTIVESVVLEAEMADAVALCVETSIYNDDLGIRGFFAFIPTKDGLNEVLTRLGVGEAA